MTLAELKKRFRAFTNDKKGDRWPDSGDVNATTLLNQGQEGVQDIIDAADERYFSKGQDYSVVSTTDSYEFTLPSDFKTLVAAERLTTHEPIPAVWTAFADRHTDMHSEPWMGSVSSTPRLYLRGNKIGVVSPSDSYTLRVWYTKRLADLALDADVSEIPLQWHPLIALHAARLAYASENRDFSAWEPEYNRMAVSLSEFIENRQRQEPKYVNIVEGYYD